MSRAVLNLNFVMKRKSSNVVRWWAKLMLAHNASVSHLTLAKRRSRGMPMRLRVDRVVWRNCLHLSIHPRCKHELSFVYFIARRSKKTQKKPKQILRKTVNNTLLKTISAAEYHFGMLNTLNSLKFVWPPRIKFCQTYKVDGWLVFVLSISGQD